ncbi:MAG: hypothetical protein ACI3Y5_02665 [Prevotella sp.]
MAGITNYDTNQGKEPERIAERQDCQDTLISYQQDMHKDLPPESHITDNWMSAMWLSGGRSVYGVA